MSKLNLKAVLVNKNCGYPHDIEDIAPYRVGAVFEVENISMGQSSSTVKLKDTGWFNSIHFEYYTDDGVPVNIYRDPRFNPYITMGCQY